MMKFCANCKHSTCSTRGCVCRKHNKEVHAFAYEPCFEKKENLKKKRAD